MYVSIWLLKVAPVAVAGSGPPQAWPQRSSADISASRCWLFLGHWPRWHLGSRTAWADGMLQTPHWLVKRHLGFNGGHRFQIQPSWAGLAPSPSGICVTLFCIPKVFSVATFLTYVILRSGKSTAQCTHLGQRGWEGKVSSRGHGGYLQPSTLDCLKILSTAKGLYKCIENPENTKRSGSFWILTPKFLVFSGFSICFFMLQSS